MWTEIETRPTLRPIEPPRLTLGTAMTELYRRLGIKPPVTIGSVMAELGIEPGKRLTLGAAMEQAKTERHQRRGAWWCSLVRPNNN
jgi:hypothetical protein